MKEDYCGFTHETKKSWIDSRRPETAPVSSNKKCWLKDKLKQK